MLARPNPARPSLPSREDESITADGRPAERSDPVTDCLRRWSGGDPDAVRQVYDRLYQDLRSIAARHLRRERVSHTLQPTALVHEAFLRAQGQERPPQWESRSQFLAYSARIIRQILVDHARGRNRVKRGGGLAPIVLEEDLCAAEPRHLDLLELHDALERLAAADPEKAAVVELRFFGGLTTGEIAEILELAPITVSRQWRRARAWLYSRLSPAGLR